MGLHLGLALGNAQPVGPASSITIDTAPAITGTAEVGETLTRTVGSYSGDGTITVSNGRWTRNGVDIAPAQTGASYTLDPADDETTVRWYEDVADAGSGDTLESPSNGKYVTYAAPVEDAAPTASGDAVIGESLTGTSGTFTGSDLTEGDEWEASDDGATGWTGTGDTDTTGPTQISGRHYRFASTASNSGGTLTTYSSVIGPAIAPTITMAGLTSGDAIVGDHASITMSADVGTITARKWGSTSGGSQFGTGTNPTDYTAADGGTLYATATVGGIDYTVSADVLYTAPTASGGLSDQSFTEDTGAQTYDVSGDFTNAAGGTWSLPTTIAGVTINSSGVVSFNTDTLALQTGTSIVARYTNSGGSADSGFSLSITASSLDVSGNADGTVDITVDDGDTFTITISGSSTTHHNGTFGPFDPADFASGPIMVVAPVISGTAGTGETLTAEPGLWVFPDDDVPTVGAEWISDGTGTGDTDDTYLTDPGDEGGDVLHRETATNVAGARVSNSNAISIPVTGVWAITGGEETLTVTDQPTAPTSPTVTGGELTLTVTG